MIVGVALERAKGERRVALLPESVAKLKKLGVDVVVEHGAGKRSGASDAAYVAVGASLVQDMAQLCEACDVVVKVQRPQQFAQIDEIACLSSRNSLVALLEPLFFPNEIEDLQQKGVTAYALERVPRISRAQSLDVLSSQANIVGCKAVLLAATCLNKMVPMMMTAAGTIRPAKFLIVGAGVAGLAAIATAKRLGALVYAYDVRAEVKEQIESLGARYLDIAINKQISGQGGYASQLDQSEAQRQQEALATAIAGMDAVVTSAQIPGKRAPVLVTREALERMPFGSVVVDLAGSTGGNVEGSVPDQETTVGNALVLAPTHLASTVSADASLVFSRNMLAFLELMLQADPLIQEMCVTSKTAEVSC